MKDKANGVVEKEFARKHETPEYESGTEDAKQAMQRN
jgi:hypothetical protein